MRKKILLVEDEVSIRDALVLNLKMEGYNVISCKNGEEAINTFDDSFDLLILDVMIPKINGFDICRKIRENSNVPVIFLSAKGQAIDRVTGLKTGANDYISKPFDLEELLLRIQIQLQIEEIEIEKSNIGEYEINFKTFEIKKNNIYQNTLSKRECELLKLMIKKEGEVVSREEILDKIWKTEKYPTTRTIDNYILSIRKYFEENPKNPKFFHSIRGVGYKFSRI